ncbi:MAG: DUF4202 domain-containing protein [Bacteroidota bacterium]
MISERFRAAIERFDAANAADPNREPDPAGVEQPRELLYARRMSEMLERFAPEASEAVRLAVRCQHIRRWEIPRDAYPRTPEGYKAWRTRLMDFHADTAAAILREAGYEEEPIARVRSLLRKERLKRDPETQLLEDVVALVFLEHYLAGFVAGHPEYDEAKFADILRKTWLKMSPRGREAALAVARIPDALRPAVERAVARAPLG